MKDASQYEITFPYGAVDNEFYGKGGSIGASHRGEDRAMPMNTPIIINGNTTIGFSGNTGTSSAPHLHTGRFVNGQATNPNGQGFTLKSPAKVTGVFEDATNGKYVSINDADGVRWVYLHLQSQSVSIGQVIQAKKEDTNIMDREAVLYAVLAANKDYPKETDYAYWVGRKPAELAKSLYENNELERWKSNNYDKVVTELATRDTQVLELKTQLDAVSKSTAIAIDKAKAEAPAGTKQPWYVRLVAALTSKK